MHLIFVDFSKNNLLTSQIGVESFYNLKVLDKLLLHHQLLSFVDMPIEKVFLLGSKVVDMPSFFEIISLSESKLYKELLYLDEADTVIVLKNNVYFEYDFKSVSVTCTDGLSVVEDEDGNGFCVVGSVNEIKKILNKSLSLTYLFSRTKKLTEKKIKNNVYVKILDSVKDYKVLLSDIMNGRAFYRPPFVAEGVYTDTVIPEGDYSIIPPVYIGSDVQIEGGSTIGPNTAVYSNTLVSKNSFVKNSILFENVYISSGCFIDGTVCCNNASIKRNTAVFSGSVIGADTLIGEDMTIENDSVINRDLKYDRFIRSPFDDKNSFSFNSKFQGLSPDKVALLGSAVATVFYKPRLIVASDGHINSLSLKLAFMSGFVASGGECIDAGVMFKSQILFSSAFTESEFSVFFSGGSGGTDITIYNSDFQEVSKSDCCNIFEFCSSNKIQHVSADECKSLRQIRGLSRVYIREVTAFSEKALPVVNEIFCENRHIVRTLESIFNSCENNKNYKHKIDVYMNEFGSSVNIKFDDVLYSDKALRRIVFFYLKHSREAFFESDCYNKLWQYDSVVLLLQILNIMQKTSMTIADLFAGLPRFFVSSENIDVNDKNSVIAGKINCNYPISYKKDCFNIVCDKGLVKLKKSDKNKKLRVLCSSVSEENSKELCDIFCSFFK